MGCRIGRRGMGFGVTMLVGAVLLVGVAAILGGAIHLLAGDTTDTNQEAADDAQQTLGEQKGTIQSMIDNAIQKGLQSGNLFKNGGSNSGSSAGGGQSLAAPSSGIGPGGSYSFDVGFPTDQGQTQTVSSSSELESAVSSASPGDVIKLQQGTYSGTISIKNSGAVNKPIFITSASMDPSGYATIDGGSPCISIDGESWIVIMNLKFSGCGKTGVKVDDVSYLTVHGVSFDDAAYPVRDKNNPSHHILIQSSHWKPNGDDFWSSASWNSIKRGGRDKYAQSTIYGPTTAGNAVIRGNEISHTFNAYRNTDTSNVELYGNVIHHVRDNAIEPESELFNFHVYHNVMNQVDPAPLSIDQVEGGPMYLYSNTGWYDMGDASNQDKPGHVWKLTPKDKSGYLDEPLYAMHNSWYGYRLGFKPHKYQKNIKHYNNAYNTKEGMGFGRWGSKWLKGKGNEFDHDAAANGWDDELNNNGHEKNGLKGVEPGFKDPLNGDFTLKQGSELIDAGTKVDGFPTTYNGKPDIGAYDNGELVAGPPFFVREPDGGLGYQEHPRITRHHVDGQTLTAFFSWPLQPNSVNAQNIQIYIDGTQVGASQASLDQTGRKLTITANRNINTDGDLDLCFTQMPTGTNGKQATYWASTIGCTT